MVSQLFSLSYDHIQANAPVSKLQESTVVHHIYIYTLNFQIFVTFNFLSTVIIYFIKKLKL
jgi:hypothetical protein